MELVLDRSISEQRLFPAMNLAASGTRHEDLLLTPTEFKTITALRRRLTNMSPPMQIEQLLKALDRYETNESLVQDDTMSAEQDRLVRQQISSLLYSGDLVNAEAMCREHLKKRTRDHEAMAMLAHVNFTIGQLQEAERVLSRAISLDAKRADYQALMAEIPRTRAAIEALSDTRRALKIHGSFEGAIAPGKAETYLASGKPDKALVEVPDGVDTPVDDTPSTGDREGPTLIRLELNPPDPSPNGICLARISIRNIGGRFGSPPHSPNAPAILGMGHDVLSRGQFPFPGQLGHREMARSQREATEEAPQRVVPGTASI